MLHLRHHRQPEGRRLLAPVDLAALDAGLHGRGASALGPTDRELAIVPMFHAMSWGMPYAALMTGASLIMPDRFLQGAPIAADDRGRARRRKAGAVPTIWNDLLGHLDANPVDISSLREVIVGGSACPPSLMHAFAERHGVDVMHAWGMTEMSPLGTVARPPAGATGDEAWRYRYSQGRFPAAVRARIVGPAGEPMPVRRPDRRRARGPRPVGHRAATSARTSPTRRSSATAGCAPATSASSPRTATWT